MTLRLRRAKPVLAVGLVASLAATLGACGQASSPSAKVAAAGGATTSSSSAARGSGGAEGERARSILRYGAAAGGAERRSVERAARAYFAAFAAREYSKLCGALGAVNREDLQGSGRALPHSGAGCASSLQALIGHSPIVAAGRKAAKGEIFGVRIKGDTAFVLFRPVGGEPSYFALKREAGAWKAISLAPGEPLSIPAD